MMSSLGLLSTAAISINTYLRTRKEMISASALTSMLLPLRCLGIRVFSLKVVTLQLASDSQSEEPSVLITAT